MNKLITIYAICYNEAFILPHFIAHYRRMFPNCRIVIYDNMSHDGSVEIAKSHNCEVIPYDTGGKLSDAKYLEIKNNCWKDATTDWVLIADCDEFCDITEKQLAREHINGVSIIKFEGYNMVNLADNMDFKSITHGERAVSYDKAYLFHRRHIKEINYGAGCHNAVPYGYVDYGKKVFKCRHYKYINVDYMIKRHAVFASRLSEENHKKGYGYHYLYSPEKIRAEFEQARIKAVKVI